MLQGVEQRSYLVVESDHLAGWDALGPGDIRFQRIDRAVVDVQFEVQMWPGTASCIPGQRDLLSPSHVLALPDRYPAEMQMAGLELARMFDFEVFPRVRVVADPGDDAIADGQDRCPDRHCEVDAVMGRDTLGDRV